MRAPISTVFETMLRGVCFSFRKDPSTEGSGFIGRMWVYLEEMYPVPQFLGYWTLLYLGFTILLARILSVEPQLFSWNSAAGILSLFLFGLILRLMDEIKDRDTDSELFSQRPLPSGRVLESDIKASLGASIAFFLLVNARTKNSLVMALLLLGYALLMFRFFFIPDILRRHLLLALATHNPVVGLTLLYVVVVFAASHGLPLVKIGWPPALLLIVMFWSMLFAWEVARRIRSPQEETAYVTYSRVLGRAWAVFLAGGAQTVGFVIGLYFYKNLALSPVLPALLAIGYGRTIRAHVLFLLHPGPLASKLKSSAEQYTLTVTLAILLDCLVR